MDEPLGLGPSLVIDGLTYPEVNLKRAFTLIELLVVIAIIAVLAAILFPVFARAKEAAHKTQSLSNLRQLSLAWQLYNGDFDDGVMRSSIPEPGKTIYWWGSFDGTTFRPQEGLLYPYTHSHGIAVDPSFPNRLRAVLGLTGYGYNYAYLSPSTYQPPTWEEVAVPVNVSQIEEPSETIAFGSAARINNWSYQTPTLEGSTYLDPPSSDFPGFHGRHNGVGNVVWCDGHAKSAKPRLRPSDFGYGFRAEDFRRENLGDVLPPGCPVDSACEDYFFALTKNQP